MLTPLTNLRFPIGVGDWTEMDKVASSSPPLVSPPLSVYEIEGGLIQRKRACYPHEPN